MAKSNAPDTTAAEPAKVDDTMKVGELWTVPAASSSEVTFTDPQLRELIVHTTPDGHGARHAQIVLDQPGPWSAVVSNGDAHSAVAK